LAERRQNPAVRSGRSAVDEADYGHRWLLLRERRERPSGRRAAAKQDDEFAPSYA